MGMNVFQYKRKQYNETMSQASLIPTWYFDVQYFDYFGRYMDDMANIFKQHLFLKSIDLPKAEVITKTINFFETEKSFPVKVKRSGDINLEYICSNNNAETQILKETPLLKFKQGNLFNSTDYFDGLFTKIKIRIFNGADYDEDTLDGVVRQYTLYNCYVTNVSWSQLNNDTNGYLTMSVTIHYDNFRMTDSQFEMTE